MCGIYGMARSIEPTQTAKLKKTMNVMRYLAIASEVRGSHSSGLAVIGPQSSIVYKSLLPSSKFVNTKEFNLSMRDISQNTIYLGHTRFATMGEVTEDNAHPFRVGKTIGAHNGCLNNVRELEKILNTSCQVDSELIFKSIDNSNTIQEAVKHIDGDFAISFVKDNLSKLHLSRETNRPLYVGYWAEAKTLFYASELEFLEKAFNSQGLDVSIYSLNTNTLYSFDVRNFDSKATNVVKTKYDYVSTQYVSYTNYDTSVYELSPQDYADEVTYYRDSEYTMSDLWPESMRAHSTKWAFIDDTSSWYYIKEDGTWILESEIPYELWPQIETYYLYSDYDEYYNSDDTSQVNLFKQQISENF